MTEQSSTVTTGISESGGGTVVSVKVVPRASRTELQVTDAGTLKLRVAAPPVDGAANREIIKFFAKTLSVAKSAVEITAGHKGRNKRVHIAGLPVRRVRQALLGEEK
jgi:uncharacterized protein